MENSICSPAGGHFLYKNKNKPNQDEIRTASSHRFHHPFRFPLLHLSALTATDTHPEGQGDPTRSEAAPPTEYTGVTCTQNARFLGRPDHVKNKNTNVTIPLAAAAAALSPDIEPLGSLVSEDHERQKKKRPVSQTTT
jgi:hypothetical protein